MGEVELEEVVVVVGAAGRPELLLLLPELLPTDVREGPSDELREPFPVELWLLLPF